MATGTVKWFNATEARDRVVFDDPNLTTEEKLACVEADVFKVLNKIREVFDPDRKQEFVMAEQIREHLMHILLDFGAAELGD